MNAKGKGKKLNQDETIGNKNSSLNNKEEEKADDKTTLEIKEEEKKEYTYRGVAHQCLQVPHLARVVDVVFGLYMLSIHHLTSTR